VLGGQLPQHRVAGYLPEDLASALKPVLETIVSLTARIRAYDRELEALAERLYPETRLLRQVPGVGSLTALTFVLTIEEPGRFDESRAVGAYLGLVPENDQSGDSPIPSGASPSEATGCSGGCW
jgi:transposase